MPLSSAEAGQRPDLPGITREPGHGPIAKPPTTVRLRSRRRRRRRCEVATAWRDWAPPVTLLAPGIWPACCSPNGTVCGGTHRSDPTPALTCAWGIDTRWAAPTQLAQWSSGWTTVPSCRSTSTLRHRPAPQVDDIGLETIGLTPNWLDVDDCGCGLTDDGLVLCRRRRQPSRVADPPKYYQARSRHRDRRPCHRTTARHHVVGHARDHRQPSRGAAGILYRPRSRRSA